MQRIYIIGSIELLQEKFPQNDYEHVRKSLDKTQCIIDAELTDEEIAALINENVELFEHEEILNYLQSEEAAGIWYEEIEGIEDENV